MPVIKCLSERAKKRLDELADELGADSDTKEYIRSIDVCGSGKFMELEEEARRRSRGKRAPSAYNIFIGECMKGTGKDLKTCAVEWKDQKR